MASSIPSQTRVVDPFASYNSNVVNQITRIVSQGESGLLSVDSLYPSLNDSTSIIISTGYALLDDTLINITNSHIVDFEDSNHYYTAATGAGYYYVVLEYTYVKSRPAPQAYVKILNPIERSTLSSGNFLLLAVVKLSSSITIEAIYTSDPQSPYTNNQREYLVRYSSIVTKLPTHQGSSDQGRYVYETSTNKWWLGYATKWVETYGYGTSFPLATDGTNITVGTLCYIDSNRKAQLAIATSINTSAVAIALNIGGIETGNAALSGFVENVQVESGITITTGDVVYLSSSEAGTLTNVKQTTKYQTIGRAVSDGTTLVDIIFIPSDMVVIDIDKLNGQVSSWTLDATAAIYYHDIDVSLLEAQDAFDCHWFNNSNNYEVTPYAVEIADSGTTVRVWMPDDTVTLNYVIR